VMGGSYGGYMSLACLVRFREGLRCGIDSVGITNFNTFLRDTSDYRRSNRRREYGDERNPKMHAFLESISPLTHASKIKAPLFVVQGQMDPRVPFSEAEQIVSAVREAGVPTWYMLGKDEGHGFTKRNHEDYLFMSYAMFFERFLLDR
jgi:dipeptidyl aminopeptidase/acylaminoacyl peptidase